MLRGTKFIYAMLLFTFVLAITSACNSVENVENSSTVATTTAEKKGNNPITKASSDKVFFNTERATSNDKAIKAAAKKPVNAVDPKSCFNGCHETVEMLYNRGTHTSVNCVSCHDIPKEHIEDPSPETRPATRMDHLACGTCHEDQLKSFNKDNYHRIARNEKSNEGGRAPNPAWDKLMGSHGFTKEHANTRPHAFMLIDQFIVDRAFGGRFQPINGWNYIFQKGSVWTVLKDTHPEIPNQKAFMRQSATANNPVCMNCKTFDQILGWAYMGDPVEGTTWSRVSNSVEMAKNMNNALNCFTCHDPHSAEPRIVRDAMIDAMTNPEYSDNLYQQDPNKAKFELLEMGERGFVRKIAILDKDDPRRSVLQCGQCHVEYNCNPGTDLANGNKFTMSNRITNHFPFKDPLQLYNHYFKKVAFQDFTNLFSGAPLWKAQHPEAETYYNSKHAKANVSCASCHLASITDDRGQLQYTSHFSVTPREQLKYTCTSSNCHGVGADKVWASTGMYDPEYIKVSTNWTDAQAIYSIDSIKAYTKGRMRKAEFWLTTLIDTITDAKRMGISPDIIKKAQEQHSKAHILWEYWTAENSDGFHNPELARESLTKSIDESMIGYNLLTKAINKKLANKK